MLKDDELKLLKDAVNAPSRDTGGGPVDVHLTALENLFQITEEIVGEKVDLLAIIHAIPLKEHNAIAFLAVNFKEFGPMLRFSGVSADFYGHKLQVNEIVETLTIPVNFKKADKYNLLVNLKVAIYRTSKAEGDLPSYTSLMEDNKFVANILKYPLDGGQPVMEWAFMDIEGPLARFEPATTSTGKYFVSKIYKYIVTD